MLTLGVLEGKYLNLSNARGIFLVNARALYGPNLPSPHQPHTRSAQIPGSLALANSTGGHRHTGGRTHAARSDSVQLPAGAYARRNRLAREHGRHRTPAT